MRLAFLAAVAAVSALVPAANGGIVNFHGRVVMEDGSPPGRLVAIQRNCTGEGAPLREANASPKTGEYYVHLYVDSFGSGFGGGYRALELFSCYLEAVAPGYTSTRIDLKDRRILGNPQLPDIVLSRQPRGALVEGAHESDVPGAAKKPWQLALKRLTAGDAAGAEAALRSVVAAAPDFEPGWAALGAVCRDQKKLADARRALERALELDTKRLAVYSGLAAVELELKDWPAAARTAEALIRRDTSHIYLEAYIDSAIARYQQADYQGALDRINELIPLDKRRELPRAEYILGLILEARHDLEAAALHMRRYLEIDTRAADAAAVRERIANLGKAPAKDLAAEAAPAHITLATNGEAPVPGGIAAFAAIARMPGTPTYQDFFLQYCRAILAHGRDQSNPTRDASEGIRTFVASVAELEQLGEREGNRTVIKLAVDNEERRRRTERALSLLGWQLKPSEQSYDIEPAEGALNGLRQRIPAAFGVDENAMRDAIVAGREFQFAFPIETARLLGGAEWTAVLKDAPEARLGPVHVFLRDWRFAKVYAALASMDTETAAAVVSSVGLVPLITTYSNQLYEFGPALAVSGGRVAVPGGHAGERAETVWAKVAGADPRKPAAFLRALLEKDRGLLMAFYFDVARADTTHQEFLTAMPARAEAFYKWYRDSAGIGGPPPAERRWQAAILQKLRIDERGSIRLPGGRQAWSDSSGTDENVLLHLPSLEPVAALATLEEARAQPLDQGSAWFLAQHYDTWRSLFPYFEKLPNLAEPEFRALAEFAQAVSSIPPARQAAVMGQWHSLVELLVLGSEAGSLTADRAAEGFAMVCKALRGANPSTGAIAALRQIVGAQGDLDESVPARLLRLNGAKRAAFDRVRELQQAPRFDSLGAAPDPAKTLAALSGAVYAALLDPSELLVAEDSRLLAKHEFLPHPENGALFVDSRLVISNEPPGSRLSGGFGHFRQAIAALRSRPAGEDGSAAEDGPAPATVVAVRGPDENEAPPAPPSSLPVFRASGRIVEVYATVTDSRGHYIDDLGRTAFTVDVEGQHMPLFAFENQTSSVSVALLFDTTGSMTATLPSLKRAAMQLIDELRPGDFAAAYGFNDNVTELQSFTTDRSALKRAVLRADPGGTTAFYDALVRVCRDLAQRRGKKIIVVFTDGDDNSSMLTADNAVLRAKTRGIPIYTIAQGEALRNLRLVNRLADLSRATGGTPFQIRNLEDISAAFERISQDLVHGYLLAFQPPAATARTWRKIAVSIGSRKGVKIRAREGYYSE